MGCLQVKRKQNLQRECLDAAQQQNEQILRSDLVNIQLNNVKQDQAHLLNNQETQNRKAEKLFLTQDHRQNKELRKNKYNVQNFIGLLEEQRECYRMKYDYLLRSSGNQSTFGSPIRKLLQKSDRSVKVRSNKYLVNIF